MQTNTFTPNTGRTAASRTFKVLTVSRECGVVVDVDYALVTLIRTESGLVAAVNGAATTVDQAVRLLTGAEKVWLEAEVLAAPAVGKPTAHALHIELGKLGYKSHYALAAEVLSRPVTSLAALTADDVQLVRSYAYGQLSLPTGGVAA
jgi:hypothetical protein